MTGRGKVLGAVVQPPVPPHAAALIRPRSGHRAFFGEYSTHPTVDVGRSMEKSDQPEGKPAVSANLSETKEGFSRVVPLNFPQFILYKLTGRTPKTTQQLQEVPEDARAPGTPPPKRRSFGDTSAGLVSSKTLYENIEQSMRNHPTYGRQINELLGINPASPGQLQKIREKFNIK